MVNIVIHKLSATIKKNITSDKENYLTMPILNLILDSIKNQINIPSILI